MDFFLLFFSKETGPKNPPKHPPQNSPRNLFGKIPLGFLQKPCLEEMSKSFLELTEKFSAYCCSSGSLNDGNISAAAQKNHLHVPASPQHRQTLCLKRWHQCDGTGDIWKIREHLPPTVLSLLLPSGSRSPHLRASLGHKLGYWCPLSDATWSSRWCLRSLYTEDWSLRKRPSCFCT